MLSAKYGAAAVNSNPHDLLLKSLWLTPRSVSIQKLSIDVFIVSLKKNNFVNKLTDSIIVEKKTMYICAKNNKCFECGENLSEWKNIISDSDFMKNFMTWIVAYEGKYC